MEELCISVVSNIEVHLAFLLVPYDPRVGHLLSSIVRLDPRPLTVKGHTRILGIGLELASNGGSRGEVGLGEGIVSEREPPRSFQSDAENMKMVH